jgi:zinc protease
MKRNLGLFLFLFVFALWAVPVHAVTIQEVKSADGIKAWLVEDHKLPLIAMNFAFRGGVEQDPVVKQGLATITMELLTEGAGTLDAAAFQQQLADHSISLGFSANRDVLTGSLKFISSDRIKAFELAQLALTKPRFDMADIERLRAQQKAGIRSQFGDPDWQARYALLQKIFTNHPYSQRRLGTLSTLQAITPEDIHAFAANHLARDNLVVAVAGDITPKQLALDLDKIFGTLPRHAKLTPIEDAVWPTDNSLILVPREGTQTSILFAMPGPKRNDPDWYAAEIANYILGGGGFSSRLMQDVRDKKGLTYGIGTGLSPSEHGGIIMGEAATDNAKTAEAWSITSDTIRHFYDDGASDKEISAAKDYLTGSMALGLTSTDRISGALVGIQLDHLGIDYLDRRNDLIRKVSVEDIQRVVKHWFNPDVLSLSMVGKPEGIVPTETRALVHE